jgi:hypothetical protein
MLNSNCGVLTMNLTPLYRFSRVRNTVFSCMLLGAIFGAETALSDESKEKGTIDSVSEESGFFVSDGSEMAIEKLGIRITPPKDWEVITNNGAISLVMQEKRQGLRNYKEPTFQRNITVAAIHKPSPIDEMRAKKLKLELKENFGKDTLVSEFEVLEHKFFNYKGKNDGLLVYSSLNIGEFPMMQMHVLLSGDNKQFLLTYTDLAKTFSETNAGQFEQAWNTIISTEVTGTSPLRYQELIRYGSVAAGLLIILGLLGLSSKGKRDNYLRQADAMYSSTEEQSDDPELLSTMHGDWNLSHEPDARPAAREKVVKESDDEWSQSEFDAGLSVASSSNDGETTVAQETTIYPKTKLTSYVTNF